MSAGMPSGEGQPQASAVAAVPPPALAPAAAANLHFSIPALFLGLPLAVPPLYL